MTLKDGRILKKDSSAYQGGPENPMSEAELDEKFTACAELALPREKLARALELLKGIERLPDIRLLVAA